MDNFTRFPAEIKDMIYEWAMRLEGRFDRRLDLVRTAPQVMKIDGRSVASHIPAVGHLTAVEGFIAKKAFIRNITFIHEERDEFTLLRFLQDALGSDGIKHAQKSRDLPRVPGGPQIRTSKRHEDAAQVRT